MRSGLAAVYAVKRTAATATKQRRLERIVRLQEHGADLWINSNCPRMVKMVVSAALPMKRHVTKVLFELGLPCYRTLALAQKG